MGSQSNKVPFDEMMRTIIDENPDVFFGGADSCGGLDLQKWEDEAFAREKNARRAKMMKVAGYTAAVLAGSALLTAVATNDTVMAGKFKLKNQTFMALHQELDATMKTEKNKATIDVNNWNDMAKVSEKFVPDLLLPRGVPDGLVFDRAKFNKWSDDRWDALFFFQDEEGRMVSVYEAMNETGDLYGVRRNQEMEPSQMENCYYIGDKDNQSPDFVYIGKDRYWIVSGVDDVESCRSIVDQFQ